MTVYLQKGQKTDLTKHNSNLTELIIGLGWDVNSYKGSYSFDLDASAFLIGDNGKVTCEDDFVFYNNLSDPSGSVVHLGDNLTGMGEGDDEQIQVQLKRIPPNIHKIVFTVTIHEAEERGQNFGVISSAFIRVVDEDSNNELIRYNLNDQFSVETAVVVSELYRYNGEWKFSAVGSGYKGGLASLCEDFGLDVESDEQEPVQEIKTENQEVNLSKISLLKNKATVVLEKKNISNVVARVGLVLDISGSMYKLYKTGVVQNILDRVLAVASCFDDDGQLDMWMYDHRFTRLPSVTEKYFDGYIDREILQKYNRKQIFGRNDEYPVMKDVLTKYIEEEPSKYPTFIVFISDGGIRKASDMKKLLIESSNKPVFWQFIGIGHANYGILKELDNLTGRFIDNANFFEIDNITKTTDEELYNKLLNEFPFWIKEAKSKGILK